MREIRTLYTWLEIDEKASEEEIKKAFRDQAKIHHPDRGGDANRFAKISQAYEVLMDPKRRSRYDAKVRQVRIKERIDSLAGNAWSKIQQMWDDEEELYQKNRRNSEHADYFAEQDRLEQEWQQNFSSMIADYQQEEQLNAQNLESILRSTDELLGIISQSGRIHIRPKTVDTQHARARVEPEIKISPQAKEIVSDLRDTISKAERLVRIFNKMTGN